VRPAPPRAARKGAGPTPAGSARAAGLAVGAVVAAGACWALAAVVARTAFDRGVPPVRMAEARVAVALVPLLALLRWRRPDLLRPPSGSWPALAAFGVSIAGVNASYYLAIDRLGVGAAIALQYTAPALLLAARSLAGRGGGWAAWAAAAFSLAGAALVGGGRPGAGGADPGGLAAGAASAGFFALYLLTAGLAGRRGAHPATVLVWGFTFAVGVWTVLAPWWSWPVDRLGVPAVSLAVLGVGLVGTLLPFFLAVWAVRSLSPAAAGIAATVEPPLAAAFAWTLLGETLGPFQVAGAALVVAGVALAHRQAALGDPSLAVEAAA
jgi:drug/metabolite transporter (DMT)-like permease